MSQKIAGVKGMNDLLPGEIEIWHFFESTARAVFSSYGYQEVRTPAVEDTGLFVRSVGEETDIVGKEMYTFDDKGGRSLTLRPEGTAPAVRAYIEHSVHQKEPVSRWYYLGPMFRYERMKTGRYRQFHQLGAEAFGPKEPAQDVELMEMVVHLLGKLGLSGVTLHLNSLGDDTCRPAYQAALVSYLTAHADKLCEDCRRRLTTNPLRVLDCKVESCRAVAASSPNVLDSLCEPCREHFSQVKRQLSSLGVPYELNPRMVRGLDYYTRTAFEFVAAHPVLGTASAVGGGGRYDKLVRSLGGPEVSAVGFGLGVERLCLLLKEAGHVPVRKPDLFVAAVDPASFEAVVQLVTRLRHEGLWAEHDARGGSLKSQMKRADGRGAKWTLVMGDREQKEQSGKLKLMATGEERAVAFAELSNFLRGL